MNKTKTLQILSLLASIDQEASAAFAAHDPSTINLRFQMGADGWEAAAISLTFTYTNIQHTIVMTLSPNTVIEDRPAGRIWLGEAYESDADVVSGTILCSIMGFDFIETWNRLWLAVDQAERRI